MKILFICSNNKDRSKTAEDLYKHDPNYEVKSAGVDFGATRVVDKDLVNWADVIVVMNEKHDRHAFKLYKMFPYLKPLNKRIIDFDIPDTFTRGDPKLIDIIRSKMQENFPSSLSS